MKSNLWALVAVLFTFVVSLTWGQMQHDAGRAEQKKWDDAWYAAHPVVKEVAPLEPRTLNINVGPGITKVTCIIKPWVGKEDNWPSCSWESAQPKGRKLHE